MSQAGHSVEVHIRDVVTAPSGSTHLVDGINKISYNNKRDLLETTDFKDTTGVKTRIAALKDLELTLSGDYEAADTIQGYLRTALSAGSSVWVSFYPNPSGSAGSKGFKTECLVESEDYSTSVDGKVEVSFALKGTGATVVDP